MDINQLLRQTGYGGHSDFGAVARFAVAAAQRGDSEQEILAVVAERFGPPPVVRVMQSTAAPFALFGEGIEPAALDQMTTALRLPIAIQGALMPDGHPGYALPIGGVLQTAGAVSPSFVGYDIACRMAWTALDLAPEELLARRDHLLADLIAETRFGSGAAFAGAARREHAVMADPRWDRLPHVRRLKGLAWEQLGSSGGGNHFADLMIGEVVHETPWLPLAKGTAFTALLTHSGSRGTGHKLATHYIKLAARETAAQARGIPKGYEWLDLDAEAGQEYWEVMELMGRYAQANHQLIHQHFLRRAGLSPLAQLENHHNFAWRLPDNSVLHRKGATPAEAGRPGLIPGSSGSASYVVEGKGNAAALHSSPHGAGRPFSRTEAIRRHRPEDVDAWMAQQDIATVGLAPDETFLAYKDIETVMAQSRDLVTPIARMRPVAVLMGGAADDGD